MRFTLRLHKILSASGLTKELEKQKKMAQNLPPLPPWEQVSTNIIRILGGNPSKFTLQGTNTYLLGRGAQRLLIDTGQGEKAWIDTLRHVLRSQSTPTTVSTCLLTHWHHDHIGGVKDLESLSRETGSSSTSTSSPSTPEENADRTGASASVEVYKNQPTLNPDGILDPTHILDIKNGQRFSVSSHSNSSSSSRLSHDRDSDNDIQGEDTVDIEIEAIHTPGHAKDHMSFIVTRSSDPEEIGALFTADNVLGHGTAVFEDLAVYLDSLALMKRRVGESIAARNQDRGSGSSSEGKADGEGDGEGDDEGDGDGKSLGTKKRAYPGHGAVVEDAVAKIDEYIAHRRMREEEALNVLRFGTTKRPDAKTVPPHDSVTTYGDSDEETENENNEADGDGVGGQKSTHGSAKEVTPGKEWSSMEMVKVIYRHYPESLYQPAEFGLLMVLEKLRRDGKVVKTELGKWRVSEKAAL